MEIFLSALRTLWTAIKAQRASKAANELPQGAAQVKAVNEDLAEITAELVRPAPAPVLPSPPVQPTPSPK